MRRTLLGIFGAALCCAVLFGGWWASTPKGSRTLLQNHELTKPRPYGAVCFTPGTPPEYMAQWQRRLFGDMPLDFYADDRWNFTANGPTGSRGEPITLTYSFIPDGTPVDGSESQLFSLMNAEFGSQDVWQAIFAQVFTRWSEVSGIHYEQVSDDGAEFGQPGVLGSRGDVRISSIPIDGGSNVLAYNYFPDMGDMVLDADENWGAAAGNYIFLRNIVAHEHGHGWGLSHVCPINSTKLLEPYYTPSFDGPQHDDIRGAIYNYGDRNEPNNEAGEATLLGTLNSDMLIEDVGISNLNDPDWYQFTIPAGRGVTFLLEPDGRQYLEGRQQQSGECNPGSMINTLDDLNLNLYLYDASGSNELRNSTTAGPGENERIYRFDPPAQGGTYMVKVTGTQSNTVQLYHLTFDTYNINDPYLSDNPLDFGETQLGSPVVLSIDLVNAGTQTITVSAMSITGPFTVSPSAPQTLPPQNSLMLTMTYLAESLGEQTGMLTITHNGPSGVIECPLHGSTVTSYLQFITTNTAEFGDVFVGTIDSMRIPVRAMGNTPLTLESVTVDAPFSIGLELPMELQPTQTLFLWPRFAPTWVGEFSGQLILVHSGTSSPDTMFLHGMGVPVAVDEHPGGVPGAYRLYPNYPNPFNPQTRIAFDLPHATDVKLQVFDIQGRLVEEMANGSLAAGHHVIAFDGSQLATGVYIYRLTAPDFSDLGKMMLLK